MSRDQIEREYAELQHKLIDQARLRKAEPGDRCPNCGGRGVVRQWGIFPQTVGCEDCAGTGRLQVYPDPFSAEGPFTPLTGAALAQYQAMLRGERSW